MWSQDLYQKTILFAAKAHQGQTIPGTELTYVVHLSNVCMEVLAAFTNNSKGVDIDLCMQSALLHDTLEDTSITATDISELFGEEVLKTVTSLTKNNALPKTERMPDSLKRIKQVGASAAIVKMADRIVNLQPPPTHWSIDKIRAYRKEALMIYNQLAVFNDYLAFRLKQKIDTYRTYSKE